MKITTALLAAAVAAILPVRADDEKKPAADKESAKPEGADAAWAEIDSMLKGPKDRPKSQDEMKEIYKKHITAFDEKAEAFLKAYPTDARRWKIKLHDLQTNRVRGMVGLTPKPDADTKKLVSEILESSDADSDTKAYASFIQVMDASSKPEEFKKLADAHVKSYPDFRGNLQIESQIKKMETEKAVKEKPLELSFTSTEGKEIDISKMRGKVILVDFWATWCGPCIGEIPKVVATYNKLHDKGFEIVGIAFEKEGDDEKLAKMTKEKEMPWPQYYDGQHWKNKFGQQFGISSIPTMWLVDKKGMVVDTNGREDLEKKVEKLLAE